MSTVAAQGTMGQTGQRTLHPFFGKCVSGAKKPSDTNPPEEKAHATDDKNESESVGVEEQEHLKRRKRRKRRKTEDPDSDTGSWPSVFPSPKRELQTRAESGTQHDAAETEREKPLENGAGSPSAEVTTNVATQKRKTLRLNRNGKLLSPPLNDGSTEEQRPSTGAKRKTRSKRGAHGNPPSLVVALKYGSDDKSRQRVGSLINAIFQGGTRPSPAPTNPQVEKKPLKEPPKPNEPPKSLHPFFLGKAKQTKPSDSEQHPDRVVSETGNLKQAAHLLAARPNPIEKLSAGPKPLVSKSSTPKSSDSLEPVWPPHGLVHVRGFVPPEEYRSPNQGCTEYHERKAKGSILNIPPSESVLSLPPATDEQPLDLESDIPGGILRYPKQITYRGNQLQEVTLGKLSTATGNGSAVQPINGHKRLSALHPALPVLISSIPTAQSAFDRSEYDDTPWTQKYAPKSAEKVLQSGPEPAMLRAWLQHHEISSVHTGDSNFKTSRKEEEQRRKKKRKKPKDLDKFIVSSSDEEMEMDEVSGQEEDTDEDELAGGVTVKRSMVRSVGLPGESRRGRDKKRVANSVLLSGPSGCGKTAAVYAVANDLGFEVFEINPGARRSARDIVERVGDMTQNHLVQLLDDIDKGRPIGPDPEDNSSSGGRASEAQSSMNSFFKKNPPPAGTKKKKPTSKTPIQDAAKSSRNQKQSLILLEEVDILFEDDKQFWGGVIALLSQSKRPIIMTCNDENLLPLDDLSPHAIFRFRPPQRDVAVDYMLLVAANEGHVLERQPISDLYTVLRKDLRSSITQLNFWCQMAVGSKKSGLDWLVNRPANSAQTADTDLSRAVSYDTYTLGMGWYSQDITVDQSDTFERNSQLLIDCLDRWDLGLTDWHEVKETPVFPDALNRIDALIQDSDIADLKSDLDLMCLERPGDATKDILDVSAPAIPEKQRLNYAEGYHFLQADRMPDYSNLRTKIGVSLSVLLEDCLELGSSLDDAHIIIDQVIRSSPSRTRPFMPPSEFQGAFEPLLKPIEYAAASSGRRPLSFEHGIGVTAEDVAPYVRAIIAYDAHLERRRLELSGLISQGSKRMRTTRASRAALEGGSKATTRRERWFSGRLNPARVLATGGKDWQDLVLGQDGGRARDMSPGSSAGRESRGSESGSEGGI